ncbi:hypothetical protein BVRB_4g085600 [Beta vulgaris subsp. vulgaris]|nr:hypothetical protein BVRB_4g085600 [Beta vulgaris subsp. vulgaris]
MSLRRRADSATDQDHDTLYMAAKEGREDVALQILKNVGEAIILYKDKDDNRTAFHVAAIKGQDRLLKKMSKSMSSKCDMKRLILQGDKYKNNPLHYALIGGHEKTARYLVEEAPRAAYKQNHDGDSPLFLAVVNDYPDLVGYMIRTDLSHGIRNDLLDHAKRISLAHTALRKRNQAVFQALLGGLPELIDVPDRKGCKLLSFAAFIGCLNEMRYILQTFPDSIMKNDEDGSLPIHKAVAGGHVNVVKELILCCPQLLHVIDKKGRNIIELATLYQSNDVLAYLNEEQQ